MGHTIIVKKHISTFHFHSVWGQKSISHYHETLGEALQGVELEFSGLDIKFKDDVMPATYCEIDLDKEKRDAFVYAIKITTGTRCT